jgi:hypothetical protein
VHGDIAKSREEWTHILSISTQFEMEKVRNRAIRELGNFTLSPVDTITLAVKYGIPAWLKPAYILLCQRDDPIREDEAEKLGLSTMVKLARARENTRNPSQAVTLGQTMYEKPSPKLTGWLHDEPVRSPAEERLDTANVERVVTDIFWPPSPFQLPVMHAKGKGSKGKGKGR